MEYDVIIVGAGLAGLACARAVHRRKKSFILLEAEEQPGGRVRTDREQGFLLDRGFQVLQTAYPEAQKTLDYQRLDLRSYPSGIVIRANDRFHTIADPRRHPSQLLATATSPIGSVRDRYLVLKLAIAVRGVTLPEIFQEEEQPTIDFLEQWGFSHQFIQQFFQPFFAGACLDPEIRASSRVLKYIMRMFAAGDVAVPAKGMGQIAAQLAAELPQENIRYVSRVTSITNGSVTLQYGTTLHARMIVLATPLPMVKELLKTVSEPAEPAPQARSPLGETCLYFNAGEWRPPSKIPFLILNGEGQGPVNNLAFPSLIAPDYAPNNETLVAVVSLRNETSPELENQIREQLASWFGTEVNHWQLLRTMHIPYGLPNQEPPTANPYQLPLSYDTRIRICGEYRSLPSIQWALLSGRKTGEIICDEL
ncbi:NAD(P)/FAD-dependent oxidoreductase [Desulfosediminicola sp.]|uniref:NAD(P)/FAD-dependent oxidoreductase n=1 Tax=Desulfosediminicola sp. TaxID=2886825 RepID=UPI003AF1F8EC